MQPMPAFSLRLDNIESVNVLKNYKYTLAIWKWLDRLLVFNLDDVTLKKEMKHLLVSMGVVFICVVGICTVLLIQQHTLLSNLPPPLPQY